MGELIEPAATTSIGIGAVSFYPPRGIGRAADLSERKTFLASLSLADHTMRPASSIGMNPVSINNVPRTSLMQSESADLAVLHAGLSSETALSSTTSGNMKRGIPSTGATSVGISKATPVDCAEEPQIDESSAPSVRSAERLTGSVRPMTIAPAVSPAVTGLRKPTVGREEGVMNPVSKPSDKPLLKSSSTDPGKKLLTPPLTIQSHALAQAEATTGLPQQESSVSLPVDRQLLLGVANTGVDVSSVASPLLPRGLSAQLLVHQKPLTFPGMDGVTVGKSGIPLRGIKAYAVSTQASGKPLSEAVSISGRSVTASLGNGPRQSTLAVETVAPIEQLAGSSLSTPRHATGDLFTVPVAMAVGLPIAKPSDGSFAASHAGSSAHAGKQVDGTSLLQDQGAPRTLFAGPQRLEVGINSGLHGWLRVRAELGHAGEVTASVVTTSTSAASGLNREIGALHAYLKAESVGVASVRITSLQTGTGSTMNGSGGTATPGRDGNRKPSHFTGESVTAQSIPSSSEAGMSGLSLWLGGGILAQSGGWLSVRV